VDNVNTRAKYVNRQVGELVCSDQSIENVLVAHQMQWAIFECHVLRRQILRDRKAFDPTVEQSQVVLRHANNTGVQREWQTPADGKTPTPCAPFCALPGNAGRFLRDRDDRFVETRE
jgi:hypothetical protein